MSFTYIMLGEHTERFRQDYSPKNLIKHERTLLYWKHVWLDTAYLLNYWWEYGDRLWPVDYICQSEIYHSCKTFSIFKHFEKISCTGYTVM